MELFYTDEGIRETMGDMIWEQQGEIAGILPRHTVVGSLVKVMNNRHNERCLLEITKEGLLIVFMDAWSPRKARACQYLKFSCMQGVLVKRGKLNYIITMQLADGVRCKLQVMKRSTKHLPNQRDHAKYMIAELGKKAPHDIHYNTNYKKMRKNERRTDFLYIATLLMVLIPAVAFLIRQKSQWIWVGGLTGVFLIHLILFIAVNIFHSHIKGAGFRKAYKTIMSEYKETQNTQKLLSQLTQMRCQPKTEADQAAYAISMSTALYRLERKTEALDYLNSVQIEDKNLERTVQEQRERILAEEYQGYCNTKEKG